MNIVVVGSCTDSSVLAAELNRRLRTSIVARIDLLKNIKQLLLQGLGIETFKNLGTYIGDVETFDFTLITEIQKAQILTAYESLNNSINAIKVNKYVPVDFLVSTFDALTNGVPTSTYSFIKVYSGVIDDGSLTRLLKDKTFLPNTVVIVVKTPLNTIIPIKVSDALIKDVKNKAFATVECETIGDVYKSEVFQTLFELTADKDSKNKVPKAPISSPPIIEIVEVEDFLNAA